MLHGCHLPSCVYLRISIISLVLACILSSSACHLASQLEGTAKPCKFYEFSFEMCFLYVYVEMLVEGRFNEDKVF